MVTSLPIDEHVPGSTTASAADIFPSGKKLHNMYELGVCVFNVLSCVVFGGGPHIQLTVDQGRSSNCVSDDICSPYTLKWPREKWLTGK